MEMGAMARECFLNIKLGISYGVFFVFGCISRCVYIKIIKNKREIKKNTYDIAYDV